VAKIVKASRVRGRDEPAASEERFERTQNVEIATAPGERST
jgi:hypothetical protein